MLICGEIWDKLFLCEHGELTAMRDRLLPLLMNGQVVVG